MSCLSSINPLTNAPPNPLTPWKPGPTWNGSTDTSTGTTDVSGGRDLASELAGILGQLPQFDTAGTTSLNSTLYGAPDWAAYAQTPAVQQHIQEARASGYYDSSWTDEAIAQNYWNNVGKNQPGAGPSPTTNNGLLGTIQGLSPIVDQLNAQSATTQRQSDLSDATSLAGGYDALKQQLNPQLYGILQQLQTPDALETQAGTYAQGNLGPTAGETSLTSLLGQLSQPDSLESGLYDQAQSLLSTNGALSAQDLYNIQQSSRAAYAGRGMYDSNSALGDEILNTDAAQRQRQQDNATFASSVDQLRTGRINTAAGVASNLASTTLARQNAGLSGLVSAEGLTQNRLGAAAGVGAALYTDPYASLGRAPTNTSTDTSVLGQTPDYLSGLLSYGSDLYNTNYNAQSAADIAAGNNAAAKSSGNTAAIASVGGAALTALALF